MLTRLAELVHRFHASRLLRRQAATGAVRPPFVHGWHGPRLRRGNGHDPAGRARPLDDYEHRTIELLDHRYRRDR